ncbi:hypothetical Protein psc1_05940 [Candidatus Phytoplasma solani]
MVLSIFDFFMTQNYNLDNYLQYLNLKQLPTKLLSFKI